MYVMIDNDPAVMRRPSLPLDQCSRRVVAKPRYPFVTHVEDNFRNSYCGRRQNMQIR